MIVYNVKRYWFTEKVAAEKYRVSLGLKPVATRTVRVEDRTDLATLLNALCEPLSVPTAQIPEEGGKVTELIDDAYVDPLADLDVIIPKFMRDDNERRMTGVYGSGRLP